MLTALINHYDGVPILMQGLTSFSYVLADI